MSQMLLRPTESTPNACVTLSVVNPTANQAGSRLLDSGVGDLLGRYRVEFDHPAGPPPLYSPGKTAADTISPDEYVWIDDLGEGVYRVRKPFSVRISRIGVGNFEASFREANIAMSGINRDDAYQALVAEILDTFDILASERVLIPAAVEQRRTLREYIVKNKA